MKKILFGFATLLLGSSLIYGFESPVNHESLVDKADQTEMSPEHTSGLTPKRSKAPVVLAQQPPAQEFISAADIPPAPTLYEGAPRLAQSSVFLAPVVGESSGSDTYVYAELERLNADIQKLKKDTAKPDTKKAWSSPKVIGRIFVDSVNFMDEKNTGSANTRNAAGFRELRLGATGNGYDAFDYKVEFGFQNDAGRVLLIDNWIGAKNVPLLGYLRVGHFKPETGLYYTMGPQNLTMMECTAPATAFGLGRRIGISSENLFAQDRIRLFFGVFQSGQTDESRYLREDNQGQVVSLRLTAAPWFAQEGKYLFHVGGHWEYVSLDSNANGRTSRTATPGAFAFGIPSTLTTGNFDNGYSNRGGLEFAWQHGRYSARSELFAGSFSEGEHLYGAYVELAYFLTDDFRTYNLKSGLFDSVKMKNNFHPFKSGEWNLVDSFGAWQAVFQWGYTDMEDWRTTATAGGHQNDFVVGMNWFWTPQLRWVFEYVRSEQCVGTAYLQKSQDIFATSLRVHW